MKLRSAFTRLMAVAVASVFLRAEISGANPMIIPVVGLIAQKGNSVTVVTYVSSDNNGHNVYNDARNATYASPVWNGTSPVTLNVVINSGVTIGAPNASTAALTIPSGFPIGSTVILTNNGTIMGAGGSGGRFTQTTGNSGGNGGTALSVAYSTTVKNNGSIIGGGGGGGSGGTDVGTYGGDPSGAGGGGGGSVGGTAGTYNCGTATAGTSSTGGNGSVGCWAPGAGGTGSSTGIGGNGGTACAVYNVDNHNYCTGGGGGGGAPGYAGGAGGSGDAAGGSGGAAGYYVSGNSNVTWSVNGTRTGQMQ